MSDSWIRITESSVDQPNMLEGSHRVRNPVSESIDDLSKTWTIMSSSSTHN
jgi:hypothetical protein